MSNTNTNYKFRFVDKRTKCINESIILDPVINDMNECLKSQGIELVAPYNSILKTVDIYLRIAGISRPDTSSEVLNSIYSLTGAIKFNHMNELYTDEKIEQTKTLFDMFNDCVGEAYKFHEEDLETIKNNIVIVFGEVVNFLNDITNFILEEYARDGVTNVDAFYNCDTSAFGIGVTMNPRFHIVAFTILSTMFTGEDVYDLPLGIAYSTFSPAQKKKISDVMGKPDDEIKKEENDADQSSESNEGTC